MFEEINNKLRWIALDTQRRFRRHGMQIIKHVRPGGALPDFLIIGAMKCGTTTLFEMLEQHPGFLPPRLKEVQFFNQPGNLAKGEGWYRAHFPTRHALDRTERALGYRPVTGEATPAMSFPLYAPSAAALVPDARLVVTLREPVERAWSHYQHMQRHPRPDPAKFEEAIERELRMLDAGMRMTEENHETTAPLLQRLGYVNRGHYTEQLEQWFRYFPRERFLILNFNDWKRDPADAARRVAHHVGLPDHPFEATRANHGHYKSTMSEQARQTLTEHFRPWNRRLFEMIGEDWGWPR